MKTCPFDRREIPFEPGMGKEALHHGGLSPVFLEWILEEDLGGKSILDLGCGKGRLSFALASDAASVLGLDRDEEAIQAARERARGLNLPYLSFRVADVEALDYSEHYLKEWGWPPHLIVAHLCMSPEIIARSGRALRKGAPFIFAAFHRDQWRETGRPSRFAWDEEEIEEELEKAGFRPEKALVEQEVLTFSDPKSAEEVLFSEGFLPAKWEKDGRADGLRGYVRGGGTNFTRKSHILIKARRL